MRVLVMLLISNSRIFTRLVDRHLVQTLKQYFSISYGSQSEFFSQADFVFFHPLIKLFRYGVYINIALIHSFQIVFNAFYSLFTRLLKY